MPKTMTPAELAKDVRATERSVTVALDAARHAAHQHLLAAQTLENVLYDVQYESGTVADKTRYDAANRDRENAQRTYDDLRHVRI